MREYRWSQRKTDPKKGRGPSSLEEVKSRKHVVGWGGS